MPKNEVDIKTLLKAYEIVGNDLDKRKLGKVANITDSVMERIAQMHTVTPGYSVPANIQPIWQAAMDAHYKGDGRGWDVINKAMADPNISPQDKNTLKQQFAAWADRNQPNTPNQSGAYDTNDPGDHEYR